MWTHLDSLGLAWIDEGWGIRRILCVYIRPHGLTAPRWFAHVEPKTTGKHMRSALVVEKHEETLTFSMNLQVCEHMHACVHAYVQAHT